MTSADLALTAMLVVWLPGYMLARSIARRRQSSGSDRVARYRHTIGLAAGLSLVLAAIWVADRRPVDWLGVGVPDTAGWLLLGSVVALFATLMILAPRIKRPANPERNAAAVAMMPVGGRETTWFLVFALAAGTGWELLYRGYLLWALQPALGTTVALLVMALSYGIAHGYRGPRALIGSLVSALLFAGAYALTHDLWWLIAIHVGLPMVGLRLSRSSAP